MSKTLIAACLTLAVATPTFAQGTAPAEKPAAAPAGGPEMPKPAAEMKHLLTAVGSWTCDGVSPAGPFGPERKSKSTVKIHSDLGGFWVSGMVKENKSPDSPMPLEGMFHQTYDAANKQYVMIWVDNMGGWATSTSPGPEGDKMTWTGEGMMMGKKMPMKDYFTNKTSDELVHSYDVEMDGKWVTMGTETCKRVAAKK